MKIIQRFICRTIERSCGWVSLGHRLWYSCPHVAYRAIMLDERWRAHTWDKCPVRQHEDDYG